MLLPKTLSDVKSWYDDLPENILPAFWIAVALMGTAVLVFVLLNAKGERGEPEIWRAGLKRLLPCGFAAAGAPCMIAPWYGEACLPAGGLQERSFAGWHAVRRVVRSAGGGVYNIYNQLAADE